MDDPSSGELSFDVLYRLHAPVCFVYARTLCDRLGGWPAAEDVVHDVFVKAMGLSSPLTADTARAYLLTAVRHAAANLRRDAARQEFNLRRAALERPLFEMPVPAEEESSLGAVDPSELLLRLPEDQREAVYLKIWGGLTFDRIAEMTGAPLQTVASRFRRGLARLREQMGVQT